MKNNWLKYLVVIALLINAVTLIFFWDNHLSQGVKPARLLIEELKLEGKQQTIYKSLHRQHHQVHDSLLQIIAAQRQILYSPKQGTNDSVLHQIGHLQEEIERITYDHFKDVRKICTPEQQEKLDILLGKTVQNILTPKDKKRRPAHDN